MQVVHCSVVSVTASAMLQTFIYLFLYFLTSIVLDSLLRDVSSIWILTLTIHSSWHKNNGQHSYTSHSERKSQTHCKCFMQLACLVHSAAGTVKFLLSRVTLLRACRWICLEESKIKNEDLENTACLILTGTMKIEIWPSVFTELP